MVKSDVTFGVILKASTDAAKKGLEGLGKTSKSIGAKMGGFAKKILGSKLSLAALAAAAVLAVKDFAKFEQKLTDVVNLMGGSQKEVKAFANELIEMTTRVPQSAQDLADSLFDVVSAGVDAGEATKFLEVSAKLATAGVTNTKTAVDGLTSVMNAYGLEANDASKISDIFFAAQVKGKTTIAELSHSIGMLAPIAKAGGLSVEEMFAAVSTLTAAGIKTDQAVTSLRGTMQAIINPTEQASQKAAELGIDLSASALKSKGLSGVLADMQEKTKGNTKDMATLIPNVRALTGVLSLAGTQSEKLAENLEYVSTSAGATEKAFQEQMNTMNAQFTLLWNNIMSISKGIVGSFAPVITGALKFVNKHFDSFVTRIKQYLLILQTEVKVRFEMIKQIIAHPLKFSTYKDIVKELLMSFAERFKLLGRIIKAALKGSFKEIPKLLKQMKKNSEDVEENLSDRIKKIYADRDKKLEKIENDRLKRLKKNKKEEYKIETTTPTFTTGGGVGTTTTGGTAEAEVKQEEIKYANMLKLAKDYNNKLIDLSKNRVNVEGYLEDSMKESWSNTWDSKLDIMQNFTNSFKNLAKKMIIDYMEGLKLGVIADTAKGVASALTSKATWGMIPWVMATGTAQVMAIDAAIGGIRGLATGGVVTGNGIYELGEQGKKEAIIPLERPGTTDMIAEALGASGGGDQNISIQFNLEGQALTTFTKVITNKQKQASIQGRF